MAGHYATPEADTTITRHLPPPEDDSTQDVSMSFVIPPQADASNLLDQNYDDFFVGPGLVTLSTPVLPRHLTNISTRQSTRKVTRTIQTSAVVSSPILGRTIPTHSTTYPELPDGKAELPETHISPHPLPSLSPPTKPFMPTTLITEPGSPEKDPGAKNCDGLKSNPALPMASIITTKLTGKQPGIQSMSTSIPSRHSTNTQNTQISRRPPIPAPKKKTKGAAQPRETGSARSTQATSKHRSEIVLDRETTSTQNHVGGGAGKRPKSTVSNSGVGRADGRIDSDSASSNSRSNIDCNAPPTGNEHSDPDSLGDPAEVYGAVTKGFATIVLPPSESIESRFSLVSGGAGLSGSSSSVDPPRVVEDHTGAKIDQDIGEDERKEDDRLTVSRLSPSKTVGECRYDSERWDWNNKGLAPTPRASIAVSPMRPSKKRVASAGQESDSEPGGAWPDECEKRCLIIESNREGEVRGGEGEEDQQARRVSYGEKPRALPQPSDKENGVASSSLTLTRRLRAKAVRESPRVRKLRDKLGGRVGTGRGAGRRHRIGAPEVSRGGGHATFGFPGKVGASETTSVAAVEGKGSKLASSGETTGPRMPYSGDNQRRQQQQQQGGAINRHTGSVVGGPYFRSTLKRSTRPVEFRFELTTRLGNSRGSAAAKENPEPRASRSNREGEERNSRKRPKLGELGDAESGVVGFEETPSSSSRLSEGKDDHHGQIGSHAGAWKGKACSSGTKGRTALVIPEGFRFSTEQRAKEREKFDEGVRVKQKEKERELEEERAAKAVEDERGIKEMRRRAVPKANSIPEWYARMPKKKAG